MSQITFHKMVASGNDFIVIDNRKHVIKDAKAFARDVCRPHLGIGADGVLLIEPSRKADLFMRVINADGSEAEACGNGYRCVGLYAHQLLKFPSSTRIETLAGEIKVDVNAKAVRAKIADPTEYRAQVEIDLFSTVPGTAGTGFKNLSRNVPGTVTRGEKIRSLRAAFINTGVPHIVIFMDSLGTAPVMELGRAIRYHEAFQPKGTNVDFVEVTGKNSLAVRTYERGVEAETLACGTGTVASAVVANLTNRVEAPVQVKTKSGEILRVYFDRSGSRVRNVFLEGGAQFVFEGKIQWR